MKKNDAFYTTNEYFHKVQMSFDRAWDKTMQVTKSLSHKRRGAVKVHDDRGQKIIFVSCYGKNVAKFKY